MESPNKSVRYAIWTAAVLAVISLLGVLSNPLSLLQAAIYFAALRGLEKGRIWCGYGPALFTGAQSLSGVVLVCVTWNDRTGSVAGSTTTELIIGTLVMVVASLIFYGAGQALEEQGAVRSPAWPWKAITALVVALAVVVIFFRPMVSPTGAMEDTILVGDRILVPRFGDQAPVRGDVIALRYPVDTRQTFLKRVAGVPGDHIRIGNKQLYLNGRMLNEPYVVHKTDLTDSYRDNFPSEPNTALATQALEMLSIHVINGEVVVPADSYFVLGDNRDQSLDSRYWGFVPRQNVVGKALMVYWSADLPLETDADHHSALEKGLSTVGRSLFGTRWSRIFHMIH